MLDWKFDLNNLLSEVLINKIAVICLLFLLFKVELYSQFDNIKENRIGIFGGLNHIQNIATLPVLNGADDCGIFQNGNSRDKYLGILGEVQVYKQYLYLQARFSADYRPMLLETQTYRYQVYNNTTNQYNQLKLNHTYDANLAYINFQIGTRTQIVDFLPISFSLLFEAGEALISSDYENKETIIEPEYVLFPSGKLSQVLAKDEYIDIKTSLGISFMLSYDIEITKYINISPEISYRLSLNNVSNSLDWEQKIFRTGLSLSYNLNVEEDIIPIKEEAPVEKEVIITDRSKYSEKTEDFQIKRIDNVNLMETKVTQTYPILPYIFFDSSSSNLNNNYKLFGSTNNFDEKLLPKDNLGIYRRALDLIAFRMSKNASTTLNIIGSTDGSEMPTNESRISLAYARARSVADYLNSKWGIEYSRLKISAKELPNIATSNKYPEGRSENRRVEITTENPNLFEPVIHSDFSEFENKKENFEIDINNISNIKYKNWTLIISKDNKQIYSKTNMGLIPSKIKIPYNKQLNESFGSYKNNEEFLLEILCTDENYRYSMQSKTFKLEKDTNQFEVGRLNLIVFDFDRAELTQINQNMLKGFVKKGISSNSITSIIGSTDKLGEAEYNKTLSQDRANVVNNYIKSFIPEFNASEVIGIGASKLKYSNDIPEGRFYCRTVLIEVKTPIKK